MGTELLEALKRRNEIFVCAKDVAEILKSDQQDIRGQARERPDLLGFPVTVIGKKVKIPRLPFIQFCESLPPVVKSEAALGGPARNEDAMPYPPHIQKLVDCPREYLTAEQIAPIVGKDPQTLRYMAKNMPERLHFPCTANPEESSATFPKWPFLFAYGWYREDIQQKMRLENRTNNDT